MGNRRGCGRGVGFKSGNNGGVRVSWVLSLTQQRGSRRLGVVVESTETLELLSLGLAVTLERRSCLRRASLWRRGQPSLQASVKEWEWAES